MTIQDWLIYISFVLIATATPGPAVLFISTNSILHGWRKTLFIALGNICGLLLLGLIAITGLGAILKTSILLYSAIKYLGAGYLVFHGFRLIMSKDTERENENIKTRIKNVSSPRLFIHGFGVAVSNPKAIIFLTALFPQFIDINREVFPQFIILISTLMVFSFTFLSLYSHLASQAKNWIVRNEKLIIFKKVSGSIFVGFELLLASSSNK